MKKALIFDLDNTIYPVESIAGQLFAGLFGLLDQNADLINREDPESLDKIKQEMTRKPFHYIAEKYQLDRGIRDKMIGVHRNMTYNEAMQPFEDYEHLRQIPLDKFLVTTGFVKLQLSKINKLGIEQDFKEIIIVDPETGKTKKDAFAEILQKYGYHPDEILVIGDDPDSEIKAARELDIDTFLFDPDGRHFYTETTYRASDLKKLLDIL